MITVLFQLALYAFPLLFLLLFYSRKNTRLIWLTIPASALALLLSCGLALADREFLGALLIPFALHTAAVSTLTAIAALIRYKAKKQPSRRLLVILASLICAAALGFVAHTVLLGVSEGYNEIFDRPVFTQLTEIQPEDISEIDGRAPSEKLDGRMKDLSYHGDMSFFAELEYLGSALSEYALEMPRQKGEDSPILVVWLQNDDFVRFILCKEDIFEARYKNRVFFVRSPQLLADIT